MRNFKVVHETKISTENPLISDKGKLITEVVFEEGDWIRADT